MSEIGPQDGLTAHELRILELIGEGLTNRQIGERLFLAEQTVKNYVSALFTKLGMERRTQAAACAASGTKRRIGQRTPINATYPGRARFVPYLRVVTKR